MKWLAAAAVQVAIRPRLWRTAIVTLTATAAPGWWQRWPPVPEPPAEWLRFRMETAYGDPAASPPAEDIVEWLEWCRSIRRQPGGGHTPRRPERVS